MSEQTNRSALLKIRAHTSYLPGAPYELLMRAVHAHPSLSEMLMEAAHGVEGMPLNF